MQENVVEFLSWSRAIFDTPNRKKAYPSDSPLPVAAETSSFFGPPNAPNIPPHAAPAATRFNTSRSPLCFSSPLRCRPTLRKKGDPVINSQADVVFKQRNRTEAKGNAKATEETLQHSKKKTTWHVPSTIVDGYYVKLNKQCVCLKVRPR